MNLLPLEARRKELKKRGYINYSGILLLTMDVNGKIVIYDKDEDSNIKIFE